MYSFAPLVDNSNCHGGFYFLIVVVLFLFYVFMIDTEFDMMGKTICLVILNIIIFIGYEVSYTPNHPINQKVTAKFVSTNAEIYTAREGKHDVEHHELTVTYRVPDGDITFMAEYGYTYPPYAILYKN